MMSNCSRRSSRSLLLSVAAAMTVSFAPAASSGQTVGEMGLNNLPTVEHPGDLARLFRADSIVEVRMTANFRQLRRDKKEDPDWRPLVISYRDSNDSLVSIPARARSRGIWRRANCDMPPLKLDFDDSTTKRTLFHELGRPKLVNFCKSGMNGDDLVLQEFQLYRVYNLLTPFSHRARLLRVTYIDSASGKTDFVKYAFITEDPDRMSRRLGGKILDRKGATNEDVHGSASATLFLFQYLVGNTDFSITALHNIELVSMPNGTIVPVAYDFDFTGAVNAQYATPAPALRIKSVRQRQFRGYCALKTEYSGAAAAIDKRREAILALYADSIGMLIQPKKIAETTRYFDDYFKQLRSPKEIESNLLPECTIVV